MTGRGGASGPPPRSAVDFTIARELKHAGDVISGLGEHGLANQVWALEARIRARARAARRAELGLPDPPENG